MDLRSECMRPCRRPTAPHTHCKGVFVPSHASGTCCSMQTECLGEFVTHGWVHVWSNGFSSHSHASRLCYLHEHDDRPRHNTCRTVACSRDRGRIRQGCDAHERRQSRLTTKTLYLDHDCTSLLYGRRRHKLPSRTLHNQIIGGRHKAATVMLSLIHEQGGQPCHLNYTNSRQSAVLQLESAVLTASTVFSTP